MYLIYKCIIVLMLGTALTLSPLNQQATIQDEFVAQDGVYQDSFVQQNYDDSGSNEDFDISNEQQDYLNQFATAMSDFFPQQTFYFNISQNQEQTFIFWPAINVSQLRGIFYIAEGLEGDIQEVQMQPGLVLACEVDDSIVKQFSNKRLGVFQIPFTRGHMKLKFRSNLRDLNVYISYELKLQKQQNVKYDPSDNQKGSQQQSKQQGQQNQNSKSEPIANDAQPKTTLMKKLLQRFKRIDMELSGQQALIKNMNHFSVQQHQRMENEFYWGKFRIIFETVLVVVSGSVCLLMLYRKLSKGYQLLV